MYLAYTPLEQIPIDVQVSLAVDVSIATIASEEIFNFGEVVATPILKVIENGNSKDIHIREGEIFLLPPKVPHSPQRGANTVGLVIEYPREKGVQDALLWFCESCTTKLYEEDFTVENIETDMPKIFDNYYSDKEKRSCPNCNAIMQPPKKVQLE